MTVSAFDIELLIDFPPRADGGYDLKAEAASTTDLAGATYPPPDSREAYAQAAVRAEHDARFFTAAAREYLAASLAALRSAADPAGGAHLRPPISSSAGPLHMRVVMPLHDASLARALALRAAAVDVWLTWKRAAVQIDHVKATRVYKRDCALRSHQALIAEKHFIDAYGFIFGQSLGGADAGPEDMTKHSQLGQGSGGGGS